jgi:hypothetical protein
MAGAGWHMASLLGKTWRIPGQTNVAHESILHAFTLIWPKVVQSSSSFFVKFTEYFEQMRFLSNVTRYCSLLSAG